MFFFLICYIIISLCIFIFWYLYVILSVLYFMLYPFIKHFVTTLFEMGYIKLTILLIILVFIVTKLWGEKNDIISLQISGRVQT